MKTCPKCGKVIQNDNVRFCKECGTDLYGKNDGGIWLGDPTKDPASSTPKSSKSETPIAKIGVIAVAIVALFLILFFAHPLHCFQTDPQPIHSAEDAKENTCQYHPDTQVKPLPQPNTQPYESPQRRNYRNAQLCQPNQQIHVFHIALSSLPYLYFFDYILIES